VISWACSIALFPFWCLDAKGGEVALLGCLRWDLHGLVIWICIFALLWSRHNSLDFHVVSHLSCGELYRVCGTVLWL
jgi:hypothetical protein